MYQALPYKTWHLASTSTTATTPVPSLPAPLNRPTSPGAGSSFAATGSLLSRREDVKDMVAESAVVVFGRRGCCMCHVVKRLLLDLGVNPAVYEVDESEDEEGKGVVNELKSMMMAVGGGVGGGGVGEKRLEMQLPAVFIGGKMFGGLDRIMAAHITGELTPVLREAGALWL